MNYIAVDTSSKNLIILVCKEGEITSHFDSECGVKHSDKIMVELEGLVEETNLNLSSLDFIACVTGAGSFTGIRIGVSTVKALCFATGKPYLAITSFDTLAYNEKSGKVLSVIDAGHNGFYACGYENGKEILEPSYVMKEEVVELAKEYKILSEKQIDGVETTIVSSLSGLISAIEEKKALIDTNLDNLSPLYVRKSQAEEGRK